MTGAAEFSFIQASGVARRCARVLKFYQRKSICDAPVLGVWTWPIPGAGSPAAPPRGKVPITAPYRKSGGRHG